MSIQVIYLTVITHLSLIPGVSGPGVLVQPRGVIVVEVLFGSKSHLTCKPWLPKLKVSALLQITIEQGDLILGGIR